MTQRVLSPPPGAINGSAADNSQPLPDWVRATPRSKARIPGSLWAAFLLAASVLGFAATLALSLNASGLAGPAGFFLFAVIAFIAWRRETLASSRARTLQRKLDTVFEQSGISLWLEDWTPVAHALQKLLLSGERDMRAYFTADPEQARALRHAVIIKEVNAFTVEMMGAPDKSVFLGSLDRVLPDTDQTFIEWLVAFESGGRLYRSETHIVRPDGAEIDCLFTAALPEDLEGFANILVSAWDITEHKSNQKKLVQAETEIARVTRITTIGALTASIAHELNSPLSAIASNAEAALRWLRRPVPEITEATSAISQVVGLAIRVREVVARTRSFLSNSPKRTSLVNIVEVVRQSIPIIDRELRAHRVSLHFDADDALPFVAADAVQIQQVMVNLMINGAQAMNDSTGPRDLTVTIRREAAQLRVAVRDVGHGIDKASLPRIFEPFFSTKPDGMGMGLTICKNCIEAHGGKLSAESEPGKFTQFSFTLPVQEPA